VNAHVQGGGIVIPRLSNAAIDLKIMSDEHGISRIPMNRWTTAGRPAQTQEGLHGYNTTLGYYEVYIGGAWVPANP
jgi:hypothetical protein